MTLWLALACRDEATSYRDALAGGDCGGLPAGALRDDCLAERGECAAVADPLARDECGFARAEREGDIELCTTAGRFEVDCRMHLWSVAVRALPPDACNLATYEPELAALAAAKGFAADDPRPWSAYFRHCLLRSRPFDRSRCSALAAPFTREACENTALAAFDDLLNMARDRKLYPCDGGPLPPVLSYAPDPALDALVQRRSDLCPP